MAVAVKEILENRYLGVYAKLEPSSEARKKRFYNNYFIGKVGTIQGITMELDEDSGKLVPHAYVSFEDGHQYAPLTDLVTGADLFKMQHKI